MNGCPPLYGPHSFNYDPLCPPANSLFTTPNPGTPWNVDWPPIRCIKTRPTGQGNDLDQGPERSVLLPERSEPIAEPAELVPAADRHGLHPGTQLLELRRLDAVRLQRRRAASAPDELRSERRAQGRDLPDDPRVVHRIGSEHVPRDGRDRRLHHGVRPHRGRWQRPGGRSVCRAASGRLRPVRRLDPAGAWSGATSSTRPCSSAGATPSGVACNPGGSTQPCVPVLVE